MILDVYYLPKACRDRSRASENAGWSSSSVCGPWTTGRKPYPEIFRVCTSLAPLSGQFTVARFARLYDNMF
jgi:hypothetical protein